MDKVPNELRKADAALSDHLVGLEASIQSCFEKEAIDWPLLIDIAALHALDPEGDPPAKALGDRYFYSALELFRAGHGGGEIGLFLPIGGVYLLNNGEFQWTFVSENIRFDWAEAWPLVLEIEMLAEEAREWWGIQTSATADGSERSSRKFLRRLFRGNSHGDRNRTQRRPHSMRAWGLATWILGAMRIENKNHPPVPNTDSPPPPSQGFKSQLENFRHELVIAQQRLQRAAQRTAQSRYWRGALTGVSGLAALCALIGAVLWWQGAEAAYAVAIPAGGLGAIVSVLQRMSSGKLVLDTDTSRDLLEVFGAVRPFIGAVFGIAVTALLVGGLVPAIEIPEGHDLAFFAGIGFLAGFNERWAQDMLKVSANQAAGNTRLPVQEEGQALNRD